MGTTYYCNLGLDFVDRDGTDSTTNVLTGPGGARAAEVGTGAATALAAGDTILYYGEAMLDRWIELTCGKDVSAWTIGATVVDNNGGAEWHGKLCEVNVGSVNTHIYVQLDSGYVYGDVVIGSGINNTTDADTTTLSAKAAPGVKLNDVSGVGPTGSIIRKGVNSSYVEDGTRATFNANSVALYALSAGSTRSYWVLANLRCTGATSHGFNLGANSYHFRVYNCCFDTNGSYGLNSDVQYGLFEQCVFANNASYGLYFVAYSSIICCVSFGNGHAGYVISGSSIAYSIGHDNTLQSIQLGSWGIVLGCVVDGTDGGGDGVYMGPTDNVHVRFSRITNHSVAGKYGILSTNTHNDTQTEDYNVFHNNQAGDVHSAVQAGTHSYGGAAAHISDPADDGMEDVSADNFNLKAGALLRSVEIDLMALVP